MASLSAVIRPARPADNARVWPLARDLATSFELERVAFDSTWAELINAPSATLLRVAETKDLSVVGYVLGNSHSTFFANGRVAWVEELMVSEDARRSGIGRQLMAAAEDWARSVGAVYLALATRRAGEFYTAIGYEDSAVFYKKSLD